MIPWWISLLIGIPCLILGFFCGRLFQETQARDIQIIKDRTLAIYRKLVRLEDA